MKQQSFKGRNDTGYSSRGFKRAYKSTDFSDSFQKIFSEVFLDI